MAMVQVFVVPDARFKTTTLQGDRKKKETQRWDTGIRCTGFFLQKN